MIEYRVYYMFLSQIHNFNWSYVAELKKLAYFTQTFNFAENNTIRCDYLSS